MKAPLDPLSSGDGGGFSRRCQRAPCNSGETCRAYGCRGSAVTAAVPMSASVARILASPSFRLFCYAARRFIITSSHSIGQLNEARKEPAHAALPRTIRVPIRAATARRLSTPAMAQYSATDIIILEALVVRHPQVQRMPTSFPSPADLRTVPSAGDMPFRT